MSYIGNQPTSVAFLTDQFSGNGSTVAFTLSAAPATTTSILVSITGVLQDPTTYAVSGTTLTFSAAPPSGTGNISVRYLGIPASGVTTTAYRTVTEFTATAGQTTFTPPSYTIGYIDVYRNGVRLGTADFTASNGTSVVLTSAATAGDLVVTESFYVSSVLNAIPATAGAVNSSYIAAGAVGSAQLASGLTLAGTTTFGGIVNTGSTGQVQFPATQNPSSDANTLDDYEEGTWTTTFAAPVNLTGTPSLSSATYTKVGRLVYVVGRITGYSVTSSNTATYPVLNLPFSMLGNSVPVTGSVFASVGAVFISGALCDNSSGNATEIALVMPAVSMTTSGVISIDFALTYQTT